MDLLSLIQELRAALRGPASEAAFAHWLDIVPRIDSSLDWDARCSVTERKLMEQIRGGVTAVISAYRSAARPDIARATVPLAALESLVRERRATDPGRIGG